MSLFSSFYERTKSVPKKALKWLFKKKSADPDPRDFEREFGDQKKEFFPQEDQNQDFENFESDKQDYQEHLEEIQKKLDKTEQNYRELLSTKEELEFQLESKNGKIISLEKQIKEMNEDKQHDFEEIVAKNQDLMKENNNFKKEIETLQRIIVLMRAKLEESSCETPGGFIDDKKGVIDSEIIQALNFQIRQKDDQIKTLQSEGNMAHEISQKKFAEKENELASKDQEITQLNKKLSEYKIEKSSLQNQINTEKEENESLQRKCKKLRQNYLQLKESSTELEEKFLKLKEKNSSLRSQITLLSDQLSHLTQKAQASPSSESKNLPYDLIIDIKSLKCQNIGWEIQLNPEFTEAKKFVSILGIVGRENSGKTFILNKLCGFDLPSGNITHTKGLSLKYSEGKNLVCLDSAGNNTPVHYFDSKLLRNFGISKEDLRADPDIKRQMINDRTITDVFIQDFILDVSQVILIVVGQMSQIEQKLIERISQKYKAKKRIIVLHNFASLKTIKDVQRQIKKDIGKCFETTVRLITNSDVPEFIEKTNDKNKENISHLIFAADNEESGNYFNSTTTSYLKKILDTQTEKRDFEITSELRSFFEENHRLYLQLKSKARSKISLKYHENSSSLRISTNSDYEVTNPLFNSLGNLVTNPPFDLITTGELYVCLIELPGIDEDIINIKIDRKMTASNILVVTAMRKEESEEGIRSGSRGSGEIRCLVPLGEIWEKVEIEKSRNSYDRGILRIEVKRIKELSEIL